VTTTTPTTAATAATSAQTTYSSQPQPIPYTNTLDYGRTTQPSALVKFPSPSSSYPPLSMRSDLNSPHSSSISFRLSLIDLTI
jgi:hypothetical protein